MTTQQDERAELIQFAKDHTIGGSEFNRKMAKIAALLEADAKGGEAVAWIDSRDLEALSSYSTQCQVVLHRFPKKAGVALYTRPQQAAQVPLTDGQELWLWRNGDHMLAFQHLYPCVSPAGDPMTLGEPAGRAVFRVSHNRARSA